MIYGLLWGGEGILCCALGVVSTDASAGKRLKDADCEGKARGLTTLPTSPRPLCADLCNARTHTHNGWVIPMNSNKNIMLNKHGKFPLACLLRMFGTLLVLLHLMEWKKKITDQLLFLFQ